ncbi:unnamed protein product [Acanthoscelides obtectus]|uniref:ATP synthase subunit b n=1 Tax=Acanthoscelides obtectus TaxID=200917 RepID=A0A9P0LKB4_ACAOB|nr:unnamed protein product [Acanthoscelides obtectus]CAK1658879.1 ATP synthase subunit b, mitochondrial [Acanthoscelides obtectus]
MLSRATLLSGQSARALVAYSARTTGTSPANSQAAKSDDTATSLRPVRQEPGKVRMGFIPEEWFQFFYKKTGVTGPYTFAFTLSTYLISKEIYVMEHEYYSGLSLLIMWIVGVKKLGPKLAEALDKKVDEYESEWNESRVQEKQILNEQISDEQKAQWSMEGQTLLIDAKRENVALQLEANYRERLLSAYREVKKRLDYQVEKQNIERRIQQKNLVDWVVAKVRASITPDQEKQNINKCIADLAVLAQKA